MIETLCLCLLWAIGMIGAIYGVRWLLMYWFVHHTDELDAKTSAEIRAALDKRQAESLNSKS